MGSGGFLLSNYQPELAEYFVPDRDVILYESIPDALAKADFYLAHEDARHSVINHAFDVLNAQHCRYFIAYILYCLSPNIKHFFPFIKHFIINC